VASAADIDSAMIMGCNHPIGSLALADLIGLDVCLAIMEVLHGETGDPKYRPARCCASSYERAGLDGSQGWASSITR
jgi:3-hydroxybutyryl-CoA dehydrogenase